MKLQFIKKPIRNIKDWSVLEPTIKEVYKRDSVFKCDYCAFSMWDIKESIEVCASTHKDLCTDKITKAMQIGCDFKLDYMSFQRLFEYGLLK